MPFKITTMKRSANRSWQVPFLLLLLVLVSCQTYYFRTTYDSANELLDRTNNLKQPPFLKAHLKNGEVVIWENQWKLDSTQQFMVGYGVHYDVYRRNPVVGECKIPISSVSLFETNRRLKNPEAGRIGALTVLGIADVALGVYCIINPKACFGSCPTFYLNPNANYHYSDAEGFSSAILPRLAYTDADALPNLPATSNLDITMKNEAMETHVVRGVRLKIFPKEVGKTVLQGSNHRFYSVNNKINPIKATGLEGDVLPALLLPDHYERFSLAHPQSMKHREHIDLEFETKEIEDLGLQLHFRQTLMSTYLFYSAMDDMGNDFAAIFAEMDAKGGPFLKRFQRIQSSLGGIEVSVYDEATHTWKSAGEFSEFGPIAIENQMIQLPQFSSQHRVKVRLSMNQGLWRIDAAQLVHIEKEVTPQVIEPMRLNDRNSGNLVSLPNKENPLVTTPGQQYTWKFSLPSAGNSWVAFLESEGYYLEWSRSAWVKDKNIQRLTRMGVAPDSYFRSEAKNYKEFEKTMEREFWDSRYSDKKVVYENR